MKCPKCGTKLSNELFDPEGDWEFCGTCPHCHKKVTKEILKRYMEPNDCLLVRQGDIKSDEFDPEYSCQDCYEACTLASRLEDDMELKQDEEGNWGYDA